MGRREARETVTSGDVVALVDGISRVALATPEPFYRMLGPGDDGAFIFGEGDSPIGENGGGVFHRLGRPCVLQLLLGEHDHEFVQRCGRCGPRRRRSRPVRQRRR